MIMDEAYRMQNSEEKCIVCERSSGEVPLIPLHYQEATVWICPQHLPILIHNPEKLAAKLPGAAKFGKPEGHPHG
jgi:hypothetical protein